MDDSWHLCSVIIYLILNFNKLNDQFLADAENIILKVSHSIITQPFSFSHSGT